tara:strand:+ start:364 stop:606 length:243 start_codon:yes stop_codon:yes gene_type:complete
MEWRLLIMNKVFFYGKNYRSSIQFDYVVRTYIGLHIPINGPSYDVLYILLDINDEDKLIHLSDDELIKRFIDEYGVYSGG